MAQKKWEQPTLVDIEIERTQGGVILNYQESFVVNTTIYGELHGQDS